MKPCYVAIGIKLQTKQVTILSIGNEINVRKHGKKRSNIMVLDSYIILNLMDNEWVERFKTWLMKFDIASNEAHKAAMDILKLVLDTRED